MTKWQINVPSQLLDAAFANWLLKIESPFGYLHQKSLEIKFFSMLGVTEAQHKEYNEYWKLYVYPSVYKKLEVLASPRITHWRTLFKMIDIQEESK